MTTVFLSGQRDFGNRGCEAIVRSTTSILRNVFPGAEIIVPTTDKARDLSLWPKASESGVVFSECLKSPLGMRVYGRARRSFKGLNYFYPPVSPPREAVRLIDQSDVVISVGGDNYSEDYSLPYLPLLLDACAMSQARPVVLWGASVGPFAKDHRYREFMRRHMQRYTHIYVRERQSEQYCRETLGLTRTSLFADPAFVLEPETLPAGCAFVAEGEGSGWLGVNISPVILTRLGADADLFIQNLANALTQLQQQTGLKVLLVPHVMAYRGANNDRMALEKLATKLDEQNMMWEALPDDLNAAQLKTVIGKCQAFVGARTHATIAAMSMGVPTVSIGYSVKASGINAMVYGDTRFVIDYKTLDEALLVERVKAAMAEVNPRQSAMIDELKKSASRAGAHLAERLVQQ